MASKTSKTSKDTKSGAAAPKRATRSKKQPAKQAGTAKATGAAKATNGADQREAAAAAGPATGLPALFADVQALNAQLHAKLKLAPAKDHRFAAVMNSIVLAVSEFPEASRDYPIVFADDEENPLPYAVTGHTAGANQYVDKDGSWRAQTYIPAYVRRYPFILIESPDGNTLTLGVDPTSDMLSPKQGEALYDAEGKPTQTVQNALRFCLAYKNEMDRTSQLSKQLMESGILVSRGAEVTLPDGTKSMISGFRVADEQKLAELPDDKFLELRKSGALVMAYAHLISMRAWRNLLG